MEPIAVMACGLPPLLFPSAEFAIEFLNMAIGAIEPGLFIATAEAFGVAKATAQEIVKACLGLPV